MKNLQKIFDDLGLKEGNGLFLLSSNDWKKECNFSSRVTRLIEVKIKPDAFFCFGNKPLILFYDNPSDKTTIHKAIWNFNESPIVFIVEDDLVEIFNGFHFIKNNDELERIGTNEILTDFNYFQLVTGSTWETYQTKLDKKNRVDFNLLNNIKDARSLLSATIKEQRVINALIGKIIFIRYLIDRKVKIGFEGERKNWTNDDLIHVLRNREKAIEFLKYLQDKFNGDMFPLDDKDYELISQNCFDIIIRLLNEDNLGNGQLSLFKLYDFSIIPIEFVSNVYESFIGEDNQKNEGAYYTPLFLVDYILTETVEKYFDNKYAYNCRVLDPACGSGIFLVETLRKIIERFIEIHPVLASNPETFKRALHNLAKNNIFGVDKNLPAIHVAIFSIQLTLLDYQNPSDIEDFRFPPMLETNFFESDFFDTEKPFNNILGQIPFDCILGNPPWKGGGMDEKGQSYLKARKKKEKEQEREYAIAINNGEIAEGFVLRVSDFAKDTTQIALIVRSSILYNLGYKTEFSPFRRYWLQEFFINHVFELAPVRKEIFDQSNNDTAIAPAAILFYRYANGKNTDDSVIKHVTLKQSRFFSFFKVFSICRTDFKKVEQKKLKEYDWLWKTLVYGSYLDFNFIKHLKTDFKSVKEIISDITIFIIGTGIQYSSKPTEDSSHLIGLPLIDSYSLESFFIDFSKDKDFSKTLVHRRRNELLFKAPMLLIREGLDMENLKLKGAISYRDCIFKDSITSIKAFDHSCLRQLKQINAIYSSNFFSYLAINTFSSIGIERERAKNYNKFSIPYIDCDVENIVSEIERLKLRIHKEKLSQLIDDAKITDYKSSIEILNKKIDDAIFNSLSIVEEEQEATIIDYALDIIRPFIINDENKIKHAYSNLSFEDQYLANYATLFLNRFKPTLDNNEQKFIAEIWHSRHIVGMLFKVVPNIPENSKDIVWIKKGNDLILQSLIKLGSQKITDQLFVQKDIRGFEADYFYIFKPNEKRLWHQAIGYLDVDEFMEAVLKAGRRGE